uniref:Uncharacterized protein n=1 Tax=Solanum tuberosum TaxID=4113 RepID=M1DV67_SOLTU
MVNTRFNGVRPVAPVNAPAEESATRGHGRDENVEVDNDEDVAQEEKVQAENKGIPPLDLVLAQQIMSFLKGLIGCSNGSPIEGVSVGVNHDGLGRDTRPTPPSKSRESFPL